MGTGDKGLYILFFTVSLKLESGSDSSITDDITGWYFLTAGAINLFAILRIGEESGLRSISSSSQSLSSKSFSFI